MILYHPMASSLSNIDFAIFRNLLKLGIPASQVTATTETFKRPALQVKTLGFGIRFAPQVSRRIEPAIVRNFLPSAFQGAESLFVNMNDRYQRLSHANLIIDAAKAVGVNHVILRSISNFRSPEKEDAAGRAAGLSDSATMIENLKASGMKYTLITSSNLGSFWTYYAGFLPGHGGARQSMWGFGRNVAQRDLHIVLPSDGPLNWISHEDLTEGIARVIANKEKYENKTLNFTGPRSNTLTETAKMFERHTGKTATVRIVGPAEAIKYHMKRTEGTADEVVSNESQRFLERVRRNPHLRRVEQAEAGRLKEQRARIDKIRLQRFLHWVTRHESVARGQLGIVDPLLGEILGRTPKGMEEMMDEAFGLVEQTYY